MLTTIGARALNSIGEFLIWQSILNSPNRQIKNLTKVSHYMVWHTTVTVVNTCAGAWIYGKC